MTMGTSSLNCPKLPSVQIEQETEEGWTQAKISKMNPKQENKRETRNGGLTILRKVDVPQIPNPDTGNRFEELQNNT